MEIGVDDDGKSLSLFFRERKAIRGQAMNAEKCQVGRAINDMNIQYIDLLFSVKYTFRRKTF